MVVKGELPVGVVGTGVDELGVVNELVAVTFCNRRRGNVIELRVGNKLRDRTPAT